MKFLTVLALAALVSCSHHNNYKQHAGSLDVSVHSHLEADLDIDMTKKIVGKATHVRIFGIHTESSTNYADGVNYGGSSGGLFGFFGPGMEEAAKSAAAYKATVPNKADVIVAPQYLVKVKSYFFGAYKEVEAQVWGYGAKVKNIKHAPESHRGVANTHH